MKVNNITSVRSNLNRRGLHGHTGDVGLDLIAHRLTLAHGALMQQNYGNAKTYIEQAQTFLNEIQTSDNIQVQKRESAQVLDIIA